MCTHKMHKVHITVSIYVHVRNMFDIMTSDRVRSAPFNGEVSVTAGADTSSVIAGADGGVIFASINFCLSCSSSCEILSTFEDNTHQLIGICKATMAGNINYQLRLHILIDY